MKNLKKIIATFSLGVLIMLSFGAFAQSAESHRNRHNSPEKRLEKMKQELGLSQTQVEQIKAIYEKHKQENKGLRREVRNGNEESRAKLNAKRKEIKAEVDKILTEEQRKKAQAIREERKDPAQRAEKRLEKWKNQLSLSDDQAQKVKTALIQKMTQMQELRETAEGEKIDKEKRRIVQKDFEKELKSILSEEQFKKYEEVKKEQRANRKGRKKGEHYQEEIQGTDKDEPKEY